MMTLAQVQEAFAQGLDMRSRIQSKGDDNYYIIFTSGYDW